MYYKKFNIDESLSYFVENNYGKKDNGNYYIYEIKAPFFKYNEFESNRKKLFSDYILFNKLCFIRCIDIELIYLENKELIDIGNNTCIIKENINISKLYNELYLGDWIIYTAKAPLTNEQWIEYDICSANDIKRLFTKNIINSIIVSFHDNNPWIIGTLEAPKHTAVS